MSRVLVVKPKREISDRAGRTYERSFFLSVKEHLSDAISEKKYETSQPFWQNQHSQSPVRPQRLQIDIFYVVFTQIIVGSCVSLEMDLVRSNQRFLNFWIPLKSRPPILAKVIRLGLILSDRDFLGSFWG